MKTIRHNTFETNSSSTHSITIRSICIDNSKVLIEDNCFYPERIRESNIFRSNDEGYSLVCSTPEQKAALLLHHLMSAKNGYYDADDVEYGELLYKAAQEKINDNFGLSKIVHNRSFFNHWTESSASYVEKMFARIRDGDTAQTIITDVFDGIILNDSIEMVDEESGY